jgi:hypothetical protein
VAVVFSADAEQLRPGYVVGDGGAHLGGGDAGEPKVDAAPTRAFSTCVMASEKLVKLRSTPTRPDDLAVKELSLP